MVSGADLKLVLIGARGLTGQDLALQQLSNNYKEGGHVDVVPLSGGDSEQLAKRKRLVARFSRPNSRWKSGENQVE